MLRVACRRSRNWADWFQFQNGHHAVWDLLYSLGTKDTEEEEEEEKERRINNGMTKLKAAAAAKDAHIFKIQSGWSREQKLELERAWGSSAVCFFSPFLYPGSIPRNDEYEKKSFSQSYCQVVFQLKARQTHTHTHRERERAVEEEQEEGEKSYLNR